MSNTQFIFINKEDVPNREQLQDALVKSGFKLSLDPEFTPFEDEGFSPCDLDGVDDIGFEIFYEDSLDVIEDDEELAIVADNKDYCISLCWGGEMADCVAVLMVSFAMQKHFNAIVSYEGVEPQSLDELRAELDVALSEAKIS